MKIILSHFNFEKYQRLKVQQKQSVGNVTQQSQVLQNVQTNQPPLQGNIQMTQNPMPHQQGQPIQQHVIVNTSQAPGQVPIHRFKTLSQGQVTQQMLPANFQQIQQQMLLQVQQAAAMGKPMAPGTHLQMEGALGIVTANNGVQISFPGMINRQG